VVGLLFQIALKIELTFTTVICFETFQLQALALFTLGVHSPAKR